jgi:hypothetical protein
MVEAPPITRGAEALLNPLIGKSVVVYSSKPTPAAARTHRKEAAASA